jgi:hypothetical protein
MLGSRRVSLVFLLLLCAVSALAQEQPAADIADIVESEQRALHQAEEQEEATEHAPISHDKAPAALEDVDEYKGELTNVAFLLFHSRFCLRLPLNVCTCCRRRLQRRE